MTVGELIEKLKQFSLDMPVACDGNIYYPPDSGYYDIEVSRRTWYDSNYPWNRPEFEYINLE